MRVGEILQGKYRVEKVIGKGGMGIVVAAHHLELDMRVAIKSLLPAGSGRAEALLRFEREARAAVKIKSEHVARVLDVARFDDGSPYLVMEYLEGSDLSDWLRERGPLPVEQAVELVTQACEAIGEAHALGIVHRDLKPANLFVTEGRDGRLKVKVLDFGISKSAESTDLGKAKLTHTRTVMGSPEYMSPEQYTSPKTVDWRTDIWSLGATLFELLTGRRPFMSTELMQIAYKIMNEPAPSLANFRAVPAGLSLVIARCLEKDRAARYQSVEELVAALAPFATSSTTARNTTRAAFEATVFAPTVSMPSAAPAPYAAPIPVPARAAKAHHALASIAGVFMLLVVCAFSWRKPSTAFAAEPHSSSQPTAVVSSEPPPAPSATVMPAPELTSKPSASPNANPPGFRGTHAVTRVTWVLGGGVYNGVVHTNGATGYVDIHTVEPGEGPVVVREDLKLQRSARGWTYVASNPRYADDGERADFIPNVFYLQQGPNNAWTFVETCAIGTTVCASVSTR